MSISWPPSADGDYYHGTEVNAKYLAMEGQGVLTGLTLSAAGTDMDCDVASGTAYVGSTYCNNAGGAVTLTVGDATNPRWDLIWLNSSNVLGKTTGTAGANPDIPDYPANVVVLGMVYVPATATTISTSDIKYRARTICGELKINHIPDGLITNAKINASADISPSKVLVSGTTHLSDWRHATDNTKIDGTDLYDGSVADGKLASTFHKTTVDLQVTDSLRIKGTSYGRPFKRYKTLHNAEIVGGFTWQGTTNGYLQWNNVGTENYFYISLPPLNEYGGSSTTRSRITGFGLEGYVVSVSASGFQPAIYLDLLRRPGDAIQTASTVVGSCQSPAPIDSTGALTVQKTNLTHDVVAKSGYYMECHMHHNAGSIVYVANTVFIMRYEEL